MIRFDQKPRLASLLAGLAVWLVSTLAAADHLKMRADGVAILGYDTVAYFTEGRPMQGKPEFEYVWGGSRWWFATVEHRDLFALNPERYAPRFGGYCTGGLSLGYKMVADPENWYIVDGQLHLHHSKEGRDKAVADPKPVIAKAEETWQRLGGTAEGQGEAPDAAQ
jgi:YHS domain-containing protein